MKVIEILNFNEEILRKFKTAGIRLEDIEYIQLYKEYENMVKQGEKISYAIAFLAEKYLVSQRTVYNVVKRFNAVIPFQ